MLSSSLVLIPFLISKIFAVQMWGVGIAGGLLPGAAEGIRRLPGARPAGSALPAKLEKLKYNIFGLHINSPSRSIHSLVRNKSEMFRLKYLILTAKLSDFSPENMASETMICPSIRIKIKSLP